MTIRIAIGCHSYLLGEGLKRLFKDEETIEIIGIFDEGIDVHEILKLNPDIIVADFKLFRTFPEDAVSDKLKFILISDKAWIAEVERQIPELILRGVSGIIPPEADSAILKKAVKVVYAGELWIDGKLLKHILYNRGTLEKKIALTKKEKEVVALICNGYRNKDIAQKLDISEQTVKSHCNRIYKKIGVSDRLQLALYTHKIWPGHI
jgi:DNA-binding NarL/FixJ family response regulator